MAGIGGKTIFEAKANLSYAEFLKWAAYIKHRGSLNVGRRVEQAVGNLMAFYHNRKVQKQHRIDPLMLMPYEDRPEVEEVDLFEALLKIAK